MENKKKAPATIEEARAALQLVQLGDDFYIACRNPYEEPKLYKIVFAEGTTYQMFEAYRKTFEAYQKHLSGSN